MDESPLNLWGDQSKRCINDVNTKNEIEGHLDDKRFATVMLCTFPDNNLEFNLYFYFEVKEELVLQNKNIIHHM